MPKKCVLCKATYNEEESKDFSLHKLPKDHVAQKRWIDVLHLSPDQLAVDIYVCNNHFDPKDFMYRCHRRTLKPGAIPKEHIRQFKVYITPEFTKNMEDDSMEIDETISNTSGQIIIREETGIKMIGTPTDVTPEKPTGGGEDVVVLLDEDEPPKSEKVEIIDFVDLVEQPANSKCINYTCKSGKDLVLAPSVCLSYYRVKNTGKTKKEVCAECYDLAFLHYQRLVDELKSGNVLCNVDVPIRNDTLEIDNSSDEEDDQNLSIAIDDENIALIEQNFDDVLNQTLDKLNIAQHYDKEVDYVKNKSTALKSKLDDMNAVIKDTRKRLDNLQINLYNEFRADSFECSVISIIDDSNLRSTPIVVTESVKVYQQRHSQRIAKSTAAHNIPTQVPAVGVLPQPHLAVESIYYISREPKSGNWIKARLKTIYPAGTVNNGTPSPCKLYLVRELKQLRERIVDGKNLALMESSPVRFELGQRVVAALKEASPSSGTVKRSLPVYAGMVAEPPVLANYYRYLIFFDIGYAQYVSCSEVHQVIESSKQVWEDMPVSCRAFIKKYLENVDDRPMVKLSM